MEKKHFWDYIREGFDYEEWDELAQDEYREYCELKREERWERDHGIYDDDRHEVEEDEY